MGSLKEEIKKTEDLASDLREHLANKSKPHKLSNAKIAQEPASTISNKNLQKNSNNSDSLFDFIYNNFSIFLMSGLLLGGIFAMTNYQDKVFKKEEKEIESKKELVLQYYSQCIKEKNTKVICEGNAILYATNLKIEIKLPQ